MKGDKMKSNCHVIEGENFLRLKKLRKEMGFKSYKDMVKWILDFLEGK